MSLPDWERNGWLQRHKTSPNEIRDLLAVVERDLADKGTEGRLRVFATLASAPAAR
jgi:hypothetical protein